MAMVVLVISYTSLGAPQDRHRGSFMVWVRDHAGISENNSFVSEMPREIETQSNIKLASRRYLGGPRV